MGEEDHEGRQKAKTSFALTDFIEKMNRHVDAFFLFANIQFDAFFEKDDSQFDAFFDETNILFDAKTIVFLGNIDIFVMERLSRSRKQC